VSNERKILITNWKGNGGQQLWPISRYNPQNFPDETEENHKKYWLG